MVHLLEHVIMHAFEDTIKLIPFLFLTYLGMEYLENRAGEKTIRILAKTGKKGPVIGGLLGIMPQCGFSAAAASLYAGGVITVGTMVAVFLSTSDEMLPILISGRANPKEILFILTAKVVVGIVAGLVVDIIVRRRGNGGQKGLHIHDICVRQKCHCCEGSILKSALIHTVKMTAFIYLVIFAIDFVGEMFGMEKMVEVASNYSIISIFLVALLGLIPNCAISVAITTFYLEGVLSFGCMFAGLLACAGVGIVVLFKMNRPWQKNVIITGGIYVISVVAGILMEMII